MSPFVRKRVGNMAEGRSVFSKVVSKHAGRAKERFLQNLGKADRTTDELFNTYVNNFNKQQICANKLQKELKTYVTCVRAMQVASKVLMDTMSEIYEKEWIGHEQIPVKAQGLELIWEDFSHKLHDQVTIPLNTYLSQFSEIRNKIAKRGRKLVDYDGCRHNVEALSHSPKKREEMKIIKAREQLEEAKGMYDVINNELHEELPALYDSRIPFFVSNMQTLFSAEMLFHSENTKIYSQLSELMEKLALENQRGSYIVRKSPKIQRGYRGLILAQSKSNPGHQLVHPYWNRATNHSHSLHHQQIHQPYNYHRDSETRHYEEIEFKKSLLEKEGHLTSNGESHVPISTVKHMNAAITEDTSTLSLKEDKEYDPVELHSEHSLLNDQNHVPNDTRSPSPRPSPKPSPKAVPTVGVTPLQRPPSSGTPPITITSGAIEMMKNVEDLYDIPVGATTTDLPPGTLYRVRATYRYTAEDSDELAFETGEIIRVIEYEDPTEQEEGWLMGMKESTGEKGLFPANFTRPI